MTFYAQYIHYDDYDHNVENLAVGIISDTIKVSQNNGTYTLVLNLNTVNGKTITRIVTKAIDYTF